MKGKSVRHEYKSIKITRAVMKFLGFWETETRKEQLLLDCGKFYSLCTIFGGIVAQTMEFFISTGSLSDLTFWVCSAMPTFLVLIKFSIFFYKRREVSELVKYTKINFWERNYDGLDREIMEVCNREATFIICTYMCFTGLAITFYIITPLIENIGKSKQERKLPFNGMISFSDSYVFESPNFELIFLSEVLPMIHIGMLFCSFDNFLILLSTFLVSQFKMLQRRLKNICNSLNANVNSVQNIEGACSELKKCLEDHKSVIHYVTRLENIFTFILFSQLLSSAFLICVSGFQVFLVESSTMKGMIFKFYLLAGLFQILVISLSANNIIIESNDIGYSAYEMLWYSLPYDKYGKSIRQAVIILIMRSYRSCYLTAGGFFPISLASFMSVMSTTLSYFTLLRQFM